MNTEKNFKLNIDELLINASLQERNPSPLPWSKDGKEKKSENGSVDKSTSPMGSDAFTDTEHNQMKLKKLDETCKRKCNNSSRYADVEPGVNLRSVGLNTVNPSQNESKDNKDFPYFGESRLCRKDVTHSANEYSRKIPMLYTINDKTEMQGANTAAVCLSECDANTQSNRRRNPRSSLKISHKMIQESKLGCSVPLQTEKIISKRGDEISISKGSPLKKENKFESKQMKQGWIDADLQGRSCLSKNLDGAVSTSIASLKRENHGIVPNNPGECRTLEINVDNELDDLLELTADAINYRSIKKNKGLESTDVNESLRPTQSKDERNSHVYSSSFKSKDCKSQHSSVSRKLTSTSKLNDTENCELRNENRSEPKLLKQKDCDKAYSEKDIVAVKYHRNKTLNGMHQIDEIQKRRVENMREKDLDKRNKRKVPQAIRNNMDIIDGIEVEGFDGEAKEPQRKKFNPKKIKNGKRQEKKEKDIVLETETDPRKTRRILKNNAKDNKYKESITRGNDDRDGMCKRDKRSLVDKTDNEEDIFDISPIKNKEKLSDFEDDGSNTYGNYIERASDLMKSDDRKENKKNDKVDASYNNVTKLIPEQTQKVSSKDKCKRSKKRNKEKKTKTLKKKDTKTVDEQNSQKKQKKRKWKNVSKTSKVNLHVLKTDNDTTHNVIDDQNDSHKSRHKLQPSKSYAVIKHGIIDTRVNNECYIDYDKDSKGSENPFMRQCMNPKNAEAGNEGKCLTSGGLLKENGKQYQQLSSNTRINDEGVKSTNVAKTNECSNQGNVNNLKDMKAGNLMYDSDIDSDKISDVQYQQYLVHRPTSTASSEFEFPRPASNRTFVIDSDNEDEDDSKLLHEETECCNVQGNEGEKKLSKKQRFINFILCCFKSKTD